MPQAVPNEVSTARNPILPSAGGTHVGRIDPYAIGGGPSGPGGPGSGAGNLGGRVPHIEIPDELPPVPTPKPAVPKILRISKVINNQAILLPKPIYPPIARQTGTQGVVNVQVLIDERGNVISAKAVSGNPLLIIEAQKAAYLAKFSPAFIGEQPVKVSGVISYNFVISR
jgi:protein TonB